VREVLQRGMLPFGGRYRSQCHVFRGESAADLFFFGGSEFFWVDDAIFLQFECLYFENWKYCYNYYDD
jgi:hypothetical protein